MSDPPRTDHLKCRHPLDPEADDFLPITRGGVKRLLREVLHPEITDIWDYVLEQTEIITTLGEKLSAVDDIIVALNAATDEIAADLAALRDEIAASDPAVAAKFAPLLDRLTELGKDPENPVPTPEPEPTPEP